MMPHPYQAIRSLAVLALLLYNSDARPQQTRLPAFSSQTITTTTTTTYTPPFRSHTAPNKTKERILSGIKRDSRISFSEYSEQDIVFPDSVEDYLVTVPRINGSPKCAKGETFCEHFDPYPKEHLKEVLQRSHAHRDVWGKDEAPIDISNRVGGEDERFVCASIERMIFPKIGKTKSKKWKYIINQEDDGFIQGVRIETCRNNGGPCDVIGELPNGYSTSCKQKYIYRRLMSLNENGTPVQDSFQLPSACCCAYKRNLDFLARFGAPPVTPKIKR